MWCINPLWRRKQKTLLKETVVEGFKTMISGVFAYPLDKSWLGKQIDEEMIEKLMALNAEYGLSPSGEGGEIETTVLDAPFFKKKVKVLESETAYNNHAGVFEIKQAELIKK